MKLIKLIIKAIGVIILAIKDTVKGHCGTSRCTYDVYTKDKVDELLAEKDEEIATNLSNVYTKGDYAVIEGDLDGWTFSEESTNCALTVEYPEGFTWENCVVISTEVNSFSKDLEHCYEGNSENDWIYWQHGTDYFGFNVYSKTPRKDWSQYKYRIVLFKHKD